MHNSEKYRTFAAKIINKAMGTYRHTMREIGQELGFSMDGKQLTLHISNDNSALRSDIRKVGSDMRHVISRVAL